MNDQELISDLLARPEDRFSTHEGAWRGKTVLITGAAGFIGSELCRRISSLQPTQIVALDDNEERLTALLRRTQGVQHIRPELADIRDESRMCGLFAESRPDIVFHTAAYKHVSLLEHFPFEAIENNFLGTAHLAQLAEQYQTARFIFISTDKATDPISIMGASKRLCEMLLGQRKSAATKFASLRCGNVLGSSGSVLPIWLEQIASGGPVTVTDESAERFFVTVREAAGALIEVACLTDACEIYSYAPGPPLRISELAQAVIAVFDTSDAIQIRRTGMQPGERVREQLHSGEEDLAPTSLKHISRVVTSGTDQQNVLEILPRIQVSCEARNLAELLSALETVIPEYQPSAVVKSDACETVPQRCTGGR